MTSRDQMREAHGIPSGYLQTEMLRARAVVDESVLPWMGGTMELAVARCALQGGAEFYLASAVDSHPKLVHAAEGMTAQQSRHVNNMMYARLATFADRGHSSNIETLADPATEFPIRVMRNPAGQRLYFAQAEVPMTDGSRPQVVLRLAVCDKNRQGEVFSVISAKSARNTRRHLSK